MALYHAVKLISCQHGAWMPGQTISPTASGIDKEMFKAWLDAGVVARGKGTSAEVAQGADPNSSPIDEEENSILGRDDDDFDNDDENESNTPPAAPPAPKPPRRTSPKK